jgi:hypothetical protein
METVEIATLLAPSVLDQVLMNAPEMVVLLDLTKFRSMLLTSSVSNNALKDFSLA